MGDETFWQLCLNGESENVKTAIDNGVDVNETDMANITGLMWALRRGHNNVVQLLLHHPEIDVNKIDLDGNSGLHWAVSSDNYEGLEALLDRQDLTGINEKHYWGQTAIMEAISCNALNCFHVNSIQFFNFEYFIATYIKYITKGLGQMHNCISRVFTLKYHKIHKYN